MGIRADEQFSSKFDFLLDEPFDKARQRCVKAIQTLGWGQRTDSDLSSDERITCYAPFPGGGHDAPVYFISLYEVDEDQTRVVLNASSDNLSASRAPQDLPDLQTTIVTGAPPPGAGVPSGISQTAQKSTGPAQAAPSALPKCFISYRRYDSADATGRIYDRLLEGYGSERIFKDVDDIPLGTDFRTVLDEAVGDCAVLLAVIGRDWLTVTDERGQRRIDDPADYVRIEIESALERNIPVIPVLVRGASMPGEDDLPASIGAFAYRNGIPIRSDPDFHRDMDRLIQALGDLLQA